MQTIFFLLTMWSYVFQQCSHLMFIDIFGQYFGVFIYELRIHYFIYPYISMNNNISPIKLSNFRQNNQNVSPFKKFPLHLPKNDQAKHHNSPFKYMNTQVNPEIGKSMAQSAHHIGYHQHDTYPNTDTNRRQSFLNSIGGRDKINTSNVKTLFIKNNLAKTKVQTQATTSRIRDRKFSHNDLTLSSHTPKPSYRKSQLQPSIQIEQQEEVVHIRDRKLSYQVENPHFNSLIFKKQNYHTNTSNAVCMSPQINRRESDMLPSASYMKSKLQKNQENMESFVSTFYSPKNTADHRMKNFPSIKQSKFRKNSQNQKLSHNNKDSKLLPIPSFLFKKSKKQSQEDKQKLQQYHDVRQQKVSPSNHHILQNGSASKQKKFSLKDFYVLKQLGQGKFGKVLLVKQKNTNFVCAMKVFKKSQIKSDNFVDQLIREMKIQLFLNHPNIIKMYGYFDDLPYIYVLIQLACEGTLYKLIEDLQREQRLKHSSLVGTSHHDNNQPSKQCPTGLSLKQTSVMLYQLCSSLKYLHAYNIIHRDLKPQNIVIHQKTIKLCDFGWSVFKGSQMRTTFCGTPLYLCPELILGDQYDQKVDIWAVGIMIYEFLIGPNPFKIQKQEDLANIVFNSVDLKSDNPNLMGVKGLDPVVIDLINSCLNKSPIQRIDIKDIISHQFFKKYCPEMIPHPTAPSSTTRNDNYLRTPDELLYAQRSNQLLPLQYR